MRLPFGSQPENKPENAAAPGPRQPSYPDRRRLDSDVRAFLRQPSTPWIVFDRASRTSELASGDVLPGRSSVASEHGMFPEAVPEAPSSAQAEPSSLVVAADVGASDIDEALALPEVPGVPVRPAGRRLVAIASAAILAAFAAVAIGVVGRGEQPAAVEPTAATTAVEPVATEAPPPDLGAKLAEALPAEAPAPRAAATAEAKDRKFGRLAIRGRATYQRVYFDGKRMLGKGKRSFMVFCGPHTIAVGNKADAREVDVPCDGELVVK